MAKRELLLGDEALALGALHAGLSGVYAYPGTPSTEITEYIQGHPLTAERGIHCTWSANEKTAMEEALGMSFAGKRALVCMKHVGMNVAADAFVNSAMTGAIGGRGGGGSTLTAEARQFLERYEAYRDACVQTSRELYSAFFPGQR